jgi:chromosome segregation ATPase
MRTILMILVVAAIAMTSCDNDTQNLSDSFDKLQRESDSLLQNHNALKSHHDMHIASHASLNERMAGVALQDSSWLETLANHEVVLKAHEAEFQKVEQLFAGHIELKNNFTNLSTEEKQAQIDAMSNDLNEIKDLQKGLESDHEKLDEELNRIAEDFRINQPPTREQQ